MASADNLFSYVALLDVHRDLIRNIVGTRGRQNLFDDLSDTPGDWAIAQQLEDRIAPYAYQSRSPIIDRPFEEAAWLNAIDWPFKHWQASRFSDGTFGVWYGSDCAETTVYETVYHWFTGLLRDAGFDRQASPVVAERQLYAVACNAVLIDLRPGVERFPALAHPTDYLYTQSVGARLHREGHPGLITASVRDTERPEKGVCYAVLNAQVLSRPRPLDILGYRLQDGCIVVEKEAGVAWMQVSTAQW